MARVARAIASPPSISSALHRNLGLLGGRGSARGDFKNALVERCLHFVWVYRFGEVEAPKHFLLRELAKPHCPVSFSSLCETSASTTIECCIAVT